MLNYDLYNAMKLLFLLLVRKQVVDMECGMCAECIFYVNNGYWCSHRFVVYGIYLVDKIVLTNFVYCSTWP